MRIIGRTPLMSDVSVDQAGTSYSQVMDFTRCTGEVAVLLSSTAGKITVTQQCSTDKMNWYDPTNSSGASVGLVCLNQLVTAGRYIGYTPVLSSYMRFKVVEGNTAATTVNLVLIFQESS